MTAAPVAPRVRAYWSRVDERLAPEACRDVLTPDELTASARFHFPQDQRQYLATRLLARLVLSRELACSPESLRFERTEYGRPELRSPEAPTLRFNLTNTRRLVACVLARGREVGIDAEPRDRHPSIEEVASRVFVPRERAGLAACATVEARAERALRLWTLKEAYMKARGLGFSLPPQSFEIGFEGDDARLLPPAPWRFESLWIADHCVSVCVGSRDDVHVESVEFPLSPAATGA